MLLDEGIRLERWRIAGPRDDIPAWFLVPESGRSPHPCVVALHPHGRQWELGKSLVAGLVGDGSRAYGLAAARAGFAVLAPDFIGFEERRPTIQERKTSYALQGENYERLLAMQAIVQGETLQGWMLSDFRSCVDTLLLDSRVDSTRLGLMGQSYGGQETIFGMLLEPRVRAGVCSCGFSLVRLLIERRLSHNMALYIPGLLPDLDFDRLVSAIAPRSLRVIAGERDGIYPVEGVRQVESVARAAWARRDAADRLVFDYFDGPHDLPSRQLEDALRWLALELG